MLTGFDLYRQVKDLRIKEIDLIGKTLFKITFKTDFRTYTPKTVIEIYVVIRGITVIPWWTISKIRIKSAKRFTRKDNAYVTDVQLQLLSK